MLVLLDRPTKLEEEAVDPEEVADLPPSGGVVVREPEFALVEPLVDLGQREPESGPATYR